MSEPRVALLRGINVGGKHRVPMSDLRALFHALGCARVETLIQSGNVVYVPDGSEGPSSGEVAAAIEAEFGFPVPVVLRTPSELVAATRAYPYGGPDVAPRHTGIGFLAEVPAADAVAALDPDRSPGDRFAVIGRDVHMHFPHGSARSKLTVAWFERRLGSTITVRNLASVHKLIALCETVAG